MGCCLDNLFNYAPCGLIAFDRNGLVLKVNFVGAEFFGCDKTQIENRFFGEFLTLNSKKNFQKHLQTVYETNEKINCDLEVLSKDGTIIIIRMISHVVNIEQDQNIFCVSSFKNISELNKMIIKLKENEEKFRNIFLTTDEAILIVDSEDGKIIDYNYAASNLYGYNENEFKNLKYSKITVSEFSLKSLAFNLNMNSPFTNYHIKKNGQVIPVEILTNVYVMNDRQYICFFIRDISIRKKREEELRSVRQQLAKAEKLASIGTLASGIAHEINNPLFVALGYLEIVNETLKQNNINLSHLSEAIDKQFTAMERIRLIIVSILDFAKSDFHSNSNFDVHKIIDEAIYLVSIAFQKSEIKIVKKYSAQKNFIFGNPPKLKQSLINILNNSYDALQSSNREKVVEIATINLNNEIKISISDNGYGIDNKNINNIFDPFFTTKPPGKGIGLGLSVTHTAIESMFGSIDVKSQINEGTVFDINLPLSSSCEQNANSKTEETMWIEGNALFVDDEEDARILISRQLSQLGLNVDQAKNGREALNLISKKQYQYLVTDIKMPEVDGFELIKNVQKITEKNQMKIIVVSGGDIDYCTKEQKELLSSKVDCYLTKPLKKDIFFNSIKKLIDETGNNFLVK